MNFASRVNETYNPGWKIRDGIFFIIDMCEVNVCIDIIRKGLITDLRGSASLNPLLTDCRQAWTYSRKTVPNGSKYS